MKLAQHYYLLYRAHVTSIVGFITQDNHRLYRGILRAHRRLPLEMRSLGDDYVKAGELGPLEVAVLT